MLLVNAELSAELLITSSGYDLYDRVMFAMAANSEEVSIVDVALTDNNRPVAACMTTE